MGTSTSNKYISEIVWLPTYLVIIIIFNANINNSIVVTITVIPTLIITRMLLEFIYRVTLEERRLYFKNQLIAFISQIAMWGVVFYYVAK